MQELEIKDVKSGAVYRVNAGGSVIGREGAKADIIIKSPSVSKRHARIFAEDGQWFIEDLGSSNGTFVANERIKSPVELSPGAQFLLAEIPFEVVKKPGSDRARAPTAAKLDDGELLDKKPGKASARSGSSAEAVQPDADEDEVAAGPGAIFAALPRAFAHYLVLVPKLALNPLGTIRRGIEEQPHRAMSWWSLAGWGIPAMLLVGVVGVAATAISALVAGNFSVGLVVGAIVSPAIYAAASLLIALIWHPLVQFLVKLLKGTSDPTSRTNHFVMNMAALALSGIASGIAVLFGLIPVPFIGVAPVVLATVAGLISGFLGYSWLKFYGVMRWFQMLVLVLVALSGLGGLYNVYNVISGGAATLAANTPPVTPPIPAQGDAPADPSKDPSKDPAKDPAKATEEALKRAEAAINKVNAEAAKAQQDAAKEHDGEKDKMAAERAKAEQEEARAREEAAKLAADKAAQDKAAQDKAAAAKEPAKVEKEPAKVEKEPASERPVERSTGYTAWAQKRDAVEKAIRDDPLLLRKKEVLTLYESYSRVSFDVRKAWNGKRNKNEPWRDRIVDHQTNGEIYEKTRGTIDELYGKLGL